MLKTTVGERLRAVRKARKLSQQKLAEMSRVSWTHIGSIERGDREARLSTVERLAKALRIEPAELLGDDAPRLAREIEEALDAIPLRHRNRVMNIAREVILLLGEALTSKPGGSR